MNRKKMAAALLIGFGLCFLMYLAGSFMVWDFNAKNWPEPGRIFFAMYSILALVLPIVFLSETIK